jgi:hypothetical protein
MNPSPLNARSGARTAVSATNTMVRHAYVPLRMTRLYSTPIAAGSIALHPSHRPLHSKGHPHAIATR